LLLNIITITKDDIDGFLRTINSTKLLRENYNIKQIIVDGSSKDLRKEINKIVKKEKNVEYYWQEPKGRSAAFNLGLNCNNSEWVWFLNGGDEIYPDLDLRLFLDLLSKNNSDVIIFQLFYRQSGKTYLHPQMWALWPPVLSWIPHPSTITKRELYGKYDYFDENLKIAMDYEFWLRCFSKDVIVDLISMPIAIFDESGVSVRMEKETKAEVRKIIRKYFWTVIKMWLYGGKIILKSIKVSLK